MTLVKLENGRAPVGLLRGIVSASSRRSNAVEVSSELLPAAELGVLEARAQRGD
jgi:hypothetical protein